VGEGPDGEAEEVTDLLQRVLPKLSPEEGRKLVAILMEPHPEFTEEDAIAVLNELKARKVDAAIKECEELKADSLVGDEEKDRIEKIMADLALVKMELLGQADGLEEELEDAKRRYGIK
jgi:hypothetical protein